MRHLRLLFLPVFGLLGGCSYVHFGKVPPAAAAPALAQENLELRTEKKILQEELTLARREGQTLRAVLESGKSGAGDEALAARLGETSRELAALRASYARLEAQRATLVAAPADSLAPAESTQVADLTRRLTATEERLAESLRSYTTLREETTGLRAEVMRARTEANVLTAQVRNLTFENDRARAALAQLNTELLAQKDARAKATQEADAARIQLSVVLAAGTNAAPATLGDARADSAAGAATLSAPNLPDSDRPETARLSTSRERIAAAANEPAPDAVKRTHVVAVGETLESIAKKYYGRPDRWRILYAANNDQLSLGRPLKVGMVIEVPDR